VDFSAQLDSRQPRSQQLRPSLRTDDPVHRQGASFISLEAFDGLLGLETEPAVDLQRLDV
jgi:hypothetical protein